MITTSRSRTQKAACETRIDTNMHFSLLPQVFSHRVFFTSSTLHSRKHFSNVDDVKKKAFKFLRFNQLQILSQAVGRLTNARTQEQIKGAERETPSEALGYLNFTKITFRPNKRLKFMGRWFPKRSLKFYSVS